MTKKMTPDPEATSNNDELDQLLASIKLSRIRQIVDQQLQAATKSQPPIQTFWSGSCARNSSTANNKASSTASANLSFPSAGRSRLFPSKGSRR